MIKVYAVLDKKGNYYMSSLIRLKENKNPKRNEMLELYKQLPVKKNDIRFITYMTVEDCEIDYSKKVMDMAHKILSNGVLIMTDTETVDLINKANEKIEVIRNKFNKKFFDFTQF